MFLLQQDFQFSLSQLDPDDPLRAATCYGLREFVERVIELQSLSKKNCFDEVVAQGVAEQGWPLNMAERLLKFTMMVQPEGTSVKSFVFWQTAIKHVIKLGQIKCCKSDLH